MKDDNDDRPTDRPTVQNTTTAIRNPVRFVPRRTAGRINDAPLMSSSSSSRMHIRCIHKEQERKRRGRRHRNEDSVQVLLLLLLGWLALLGDKRHHISVVCKMVVLLFEFFWLTTPSCLRHRRWPPPPSWSQSVGSMREDVEILHDPIVVLLHCSPPAGIVDGDGGAVLRRYHHLETVLSYCWSLSPCNCPRRWSEDQERYSTE
jgi:hypothetical protein